MPFVEHRIHARSLIETIEQQISRPMKEQQISRPMKPLEIEALRLGVEIAKVYALLSIEERLGYIQNRISRLDKEV